MEPTAPAAGANTNAVAGPSKPKKADNLITRYHLESRTSATDVNASPEAVGGKSVWQDTAEKREASLRERKAQMILAAREYVFPPVLRARYPRSGVPHADKIRSHPLPGASVGVQATIGATGEGEGGSGRRVSVKMCRPTPPPSRTPEGHGLRLSWSFWKCAIPSYCTSIYCSVSPRPFRASDMPPTASHCPLGVGTWTLTVTGVPVYAALGKNKRRTRNKSASPTLKEAVKPLGNLVRPDASAGRCIPASRSTPNRTGAMGLLR